ncbi:YdcF family protein [Fulvivirgaceae bacterium PWU4]|uniref:YdcF family protein n=1 Tax=Chryseosolibacter histidini TaxID=2782349 RepID=A0AAP2GQU8_9BACT|nr:ElyC/SanA/YdcF family protein [Chryseosolibacter histidini]MBT1700508.1 YdcF family protein [Chryseosolibacter histidini]
MYRFFNDMLHPLVILWLLIIVCLVARRFGKKRLFQICLYTAAIWFFVISISPVPQWLIHRLEDTYPVVDIAEAGGAPDVHILVMGAGHAYAPGLPHLNQLSDPARARLNEAIRLHRLLPGSRIVCSGYSASGRIPQAEMLAKAALELGVAPADTLMVPTPANSAEEAKDYSRRFGKQHKLVLVTSAFHMRRAMKYFEREGLAPVAAPTDHYIKRDPQKNAYDFWPSSAKIHMMALVIHEYGGLAKLALTK